MSSRNGRTLRPARGERARLRAAVLHLGLQLGWQPDEVIAFSGALTGGCWRNTPPADLETALPEYLILLRPTPSPASTGQAAPARRERRLPCRSGNGRGDYAAEGGDRADRD